MKKTITSTLVAVSALGLFAVTNNTTQANTNTQNVTTTATSQDTIGPNEHVFIPTNKTPDSDYPVGTTKSDFFSTVTRIIRYVYEDGNLIYTIPNRPRGTYTSNRIFIRDAVVDNATGKVVRFLEPDPDKLLMSTVPSPDVPGYTPDIKVVTGDYVYANTPSYTVTVTYTKNDDKTDNSNGITEDNNNNNSSENNGNLEDNPNNSHEDSNSNDEISDNNSSHTNEDTTDNNDNVTQEIEYVDNNGNVILKDDLIGKENTSISYNDSADLKKLEEFGYTVNDASIPSKIKLGNCNGITKIIVTKTSKTSNSNLPATGQSNQNVFISIIGIIFTFLSSSLLFKFKEKYNR